MHGAPQASLQGHFRGHFASDHGAKSKEQPRDTLVLEAVARSEGVVVSIRPAGTGCKLTLRQETTTIECLVSAREPRYAA